MKKVLIFLILILVAYFAVEVYKRNNIKEDVEYIFDENYIFSFSYNDNTISQIVYKTYYFYDNEKVVLEKSSIDRSTGETLKNEYLDIKINNKNFSTSNILNSINDYGTDLVNIYTYRIYRKDIDKMYVLSSKSKAVTTLLDVLNIDKGK